MKNFYLALFFATINYMLFAQCNASNFTLTPTHGTCASNASIAVAIPGASTCSGWVANLTKVGTPGIYASQALSTVGSTTFNNLPAGDYNVTIVSGVQSFGPRAINLTTNYVALNYTTNLQTPGCQDVNAPMYAPNAIITVNITAGTGLAPYTYSAVAPSYPMQTSGSTSATTHSFNNLPTAETVDISVTDACGTIINSNVAINNVPSTLPLVTGTWGGNSYMKKRCNADGTCENLFQLIAWVSSSKVWTNSFYSVNGGPELPYTTTSGIGWDTRYGDVTWGDQITSRFSDGCYDTILVHNVPPYPSGKPDFVNWTNLNNNCDTVYAVRMRHSLGELNYLCNGNNTIKIEYEVSPNVWILDTIYKNTNVWGDINSCTSLILHNGTGRYRFISSDSCYLDTSYYTMNLYISPIADFLLKNQSSILENTGTIWFGYSSGMTIPLTLSVSPTNGASSTTFTASNPGIVGSHSGTYTINWPQTFNHTMPTWELFGDLPIDSYNVTMTDACGRTATKQITLDTTRYNFQYSVVPDCNSSTVNFDFNTENRYSDTRGTFHLFENIGGVPGAVVPGVVFSHNDLNDNTISNVPYGEYFIAFKNYNHEFGLQAYSAVFGSNINNYTYQPISVQPVLPISVTTSPFVCDLNNPNSGAVHVSLTTGTGVFPITYTLYSTTDLVTPIATYTTPDSSSFTHVFNNLAFGDYVVVANDACSQSTSTISVSGTAANYQANASDTVVCPASPSVLLTVPINDAVFDINWYNQNNVLVGTGDSVTVVVPTSPAGTYTYTITYSPNASTGCINPPVQSITKQITVVPNANLTSSVSNVDVCNDTLYQVTINNTQTAYQYTLLDNTGNPFTNSQASAWGNGGALTLTYPSGFTATVGTVLGVSITNSNAGCGNVLVDSVRFNSGTPNLDLQVLPGFIYCPNSVGEIKILHPQGHLTYTVLDENGNPFLPNISGNSTTDTLTLSIPLPNPTVGYHNLRVRVSGTGCIASNLSSEVFIDIADTTAPTAICQDLTVYLDALGNATVTANQIDNGSSDVCSNVTLSLSQTNFSCADRGENTVTLTVRDESNNVATCTAIVTVLDTIAPIVIACKNDTTLYLDEHCHVFVPDFTNVMGIQLEDNCDTLLTNFTVSQSPLPGVEIESNTTIYLFISDISGNSTTCQFTIYVQDTISPVITKCIENQKEEVNQYCNTVVKDYRHHFGLDMEDNCSTPNMDISITQVPTPGSVINKDTVVWVFVEDASGNRDSCSFELKLGACEIIITESFSPNGDNLNQVFYIENLSFFPNTVVTIYNRWGAEVYHSDDYQNDWDGRSQNKLNIGGDELPEGTYFYVLQLGGEGQENFEKTYKGYVYLKR